MKRYKSTTILGGGPPGKIVQCQSFSIKLTKIGVRINELLNIKVSDLTTLIQEYWIAIDRSKRGPSNHKAFLTKQGKKIIQDRKKDFELIFLMKELNAYLFTSEADHFKKNYSRC